MPPSLECPAPQLRGTVDMRGEAHKIRAPRQTILKALVLIANADIPRGRCKRRHVTQVERRDRKLGRASRGPVVNYLRGMNQQQPPFQTTSLRF
jgi:hypothetical protein